MRWNLRSLLICSFDRSRPILSEKPLPSLIKIAAAGLKPVVIDHSQGPIALITVPI